MLTPFFAASNNFHYNGQTSIEEIALSKKNHFFLPLAVDTEYEQVHANFNHPEPVEKFSKTITVQVKHINADEGIIFTHPDCAAIARHPVMTEALVVVDYLKKLGYKCKLREFDSNLRYEYKAKTLQIDLYAHFAIAELFRIGTGNWKKTAQSLCLGRDKVQRIKQGRRLITENSRMPGVTEQWVSLNRFLLKINGVEFQLNLRIYDTIAILGQQSYANLAMLGGHELKYKDNFTKEQKEQMIRMYTEHPQEFDEYALGDLDVYDILLKVEERISKIYDEVELSDYFKLGESMRLTIGATVAKMFENRLLQHMSIKDIRVLRDLTKDGTTEVIKQRTDTSLWCAKVDGGRCRNNRPTDISVRGLLCDIDINGCYGNGLRNQIYPIGTPVLIGLPLKADNNKFDTLKEFLKKYGHDLVPGLWMLRVSLKAGYKLKYPQDFLVSWFPPKDLSKIPTDSDLEGEEWWTEDNVGETKILTREINLAVLTHDSLQTIEHICSPRQKKELMENLEVVGAMYYPKSNRVTTPEQLLKARAEHNGVNTCEVKGRKKKTKVTKENYCHAWYGVNLGDLIVDALMTRRGQYSKKNPNQKPFNELYKLCINTIYGDQVSPYFEIGNACVGNNITARARAMAWYMEKGLHGFQSITDGCAFELNSIICNRNQRLTTVEVFEAYVKGSDKGNFRFQPLGSSEIILKGWKQGSDYDIALLEQNDTPLSYEDIATMAMEHLQNLFPDVDVLHKPTKGLKGEEYKGQFTLELKGVFSGGAFHGSANYIFNQDSQGFGKAKMRSYSKGNRKAILQTDNEVQIIDSEYSPANNLLQGIYTNPKSVDVGLPFIDKSILKVGTYKQRFETIGENSPIHPGEEIARVRITRLFSLNQFTFQTYEQYKSWKNEYEKLLKRYGWSYETFFVNNNHNGVNYEAMVKAVDYRLRNGSKTFLSRGVLSNHLKKGIDTLESHPGWNTVIEMRKRFEIQHGCAIELDDDSLVES